MKKKTLKSIFAVAIILLLIIAVVKFLPAITVCFASAVWIIMPFLLSYIISLFANNMADGLQKRFKMPRKVSAVIVIILIVGVIGGILTGVIWKIIDEIKQLYDNFPNIYLNIQTSWRNISERFDDIVETMPYNVQIILSNIYSDVMDWLGNIVKNANFLETAGNVAKKVPGILVSIITFILSLYFMISDSNRIEDNLKRFISPKIVKRASQLKIELKKYLGGYLKAQLIIMCIAFAIILTGLLIMRIEYALIIALAIAIFDAIPFFGSGAVFIPWAIINFMLGNISGGIGMLIIYLIVLLMRQFIEPKIVGENIGLHPLLTLFSMYAGYKIFSIGGIILGPIVMMIIVSFYKIGIFDGLCKITVSTAKKVKKNYDEFVGSEDDKGE